tara:strand:- start:1966 stop:2352 length:387 start_codon:yes stop_codon:yes gene_type:complete
MARLTAQQKLNLANKRITELHEQLLVAEERGKAADIEAATAIKKYDNLESSLTTSTRRVSLLEVELATLRGYTQRIIQTDNAHHNPAIVEREGLPAEMHLKFGMPEVDPGTVRLGVAPEYADSFYRNR